MRGNGNSSGFSTVRASSIYAELNRVGMRKP
jgi:hypothetical protein